ncbi:MAG: hypothetical protein V4792_03565 [Pseudomonadota bacterium]
MRRPTFPTLRRAAAAIALSCVAAGMSLQAQTFDAGDEDPVGELAGELMFRADLLSSLDTLCPRGRPAPDWHAALPALPPEAQTLELIDLSRRLGADAGQQLVRQTGGCGTRDFSAAYDESRQTFSELIERWQQL